MTQFTKAQQQLDDSVTAAEVIMTNAKDAATQQPEPLVGRKRPRTCGDVDAEYEAKYGRKTRKQMYHDARGCVVIRVIDTEGDEKPITYVVPKLTFEYDVQTYCKWHTDPYCALAKFPTRCGSHVGDLLDRWHQFIVRKHHVGEPFCVISIEYDDLLDTPLDDDDAPRALVDLSDTEQEEDDEQ